MLYWKKEIEVLSRLLKTFGMKEVKAMVDVYPCDGDMAKNLTAISFHWAEIVIGEKIKQIWDWIWCKFQLHLMNQMEMKYFGCMPHPTWLVMPWRWWSLRSLANWLHYSKEVLNFLIRRTIHHEVCGWPKLYEFTLILGKMWMWHTILQ